jgi:hypothetical protein
MRIPLLAMTVVAVGLLSAYSQQAIPKPSSTSSPNGRYQLISAPVGEATGDSTVFLLDTATGNVWRYQPAYSAKGTDGKETIVPAMFFPIPVRMFP